MDIDRAAYVAVEARIEQPGRIGERRALGEGHLDVGLVGLAGADHAVAIPDGNAATLPFLDDVGIGCEDDAAPVREHLDAPVATRTDAIEIGRAACGEREYKYV